MFVIKQSDTFKWPVEFRTAADGGTFDTQTITLTFKRLKQSEIEALTKGEGATDAGFARAVTKGWEGVQDAGGQDVPFSAKAFDDLLDIPIVATTITLAYMESATGGGAKRKN